MTPAHVATDPRRRVWRVRRRHDHIDAELCQRGGSWELCYRHNDRVLLVWRYDSQASALAEADARLDALVHAGWAMHW